MKKTIIEMISAFSMIVVGMFALGMLDANAAPAPSSPGQITAVTLNSQCDSVADRARIPIGITQVQVISAALAMGTPQTAESNSAVITIGQISDAFRAALTECQIAEDALSFAEITPTSDINGAQTAFNSALSSLKSVALEISTLNSFPLTAEDERVGSIIGNLHNNLLNQIQGAQNYADSVEKIRNDMRDLLTVQLQMAVDCLVGEKQGTGSSSCESQILAMGANAAPMIQNELGADVPILQTLTGQLSQAQVAFSQNQSLMQSAQSQIQSLQGQLAYYQNQIAVLNWYAAYYWNTRNYLAYSYFAWYWIPAAQNTLASLQNQITQETGTISNLQNQMQQQMMQIQSIKSAIVSIGS